MAIPDTENFTLAANGVSQNITGPLKQVVFFDYGAGTTVNVHIDPGDGTFRLLEVITLDNTYEIQIETFNYILPRNAILRLTAIGGGVSVIVAPY